MEILEHVKELVGPTGEIIGYIIGATVTIGYGIYSISKYVPSFIKNSISKYFISERKEHEIASKYRKSIIPKIKKELSFLAETVDVDRAVLFEFSNGTSNLVGLPFLYTSATTEVVRCKIQPVSHLYQKTNVSLFADFIEDLETATYVYFKHIEDIKEVYPNLYNSMKPYGAESAIFYALYDDENSIGFLALSCVNRSFERSDVLPKLAATAQTVSTLLNYNKIKKELN